MSTAVYDPAFHRAMDEKALRSARRVLPLVFELVRPASVVDVGCGTGAWLAVAAELGARVVAGVDQEGVPAEALRIPAAAFAAHDLSRPLPLAGPFDLAISLEVAEHLPPERAAGFVAELARLAPVVLFSAAIPGQGGRGHLNEQWPDYWAALFATHGFLPADALRPRIWSEAEVAVYYRQNLLLFVSERIPPQRPGLAAAVRATVPGQLSLVHPVTWQALLSRG